jgi:hemerythrin-like domain-containing protein
MNPTFDLKREHDAMDIVLAAMKKLAHNIREGIHVDLFRIGQILEFLKIYNHKSHHEKEETILFPAILECDIPWTAETINILTNEHLLARHYMNETDYFLHEHLSGNNNAFESLASSMFNYITLEENHIRIENNILLPLADRIFDKKKQETLCMDFKTIQDQEVGHNKNLEYYKLLQKLYSETKTIYADDLMAESVYGS